MSKIEMTEKDLAIIMESAILLGQANPKHDAKELLITLCKEINKATQND